MTVKRVLITIYLNLILIPLNICLAPGLDQKASDDYFTRAKAEVNRMEYEREFARYAKHLGYKESSNRPEVINAIGCMGEYQYSYRTLKFLGYSHITPKAFRKDPGIFPPDLQYKVLCTHVKTNELLLKDYMCFVGTTINGVKITRSGLLAAAHLAGARGVRLFLLTEGKDNRRDMNGTTITDYLREFSGYKI